MPYDRIEKCIMLQKSITGIRRCGKSYLLLLENGSDHIIADLDTV